MSPFVSDDKITLISVHIYFGRVAVPTQSPHSVQLEPVAEVKRAKNIIIPQQNG
jgi:hypothetical protein